MRNWLFFSVCFLVLLNGSAGGQTVTGDILGTLADPQGSVIPGAEITLRNVETNAALTTLTSDTGRYIFPRLDPGKYEIVVEFPGFKRSTTRDITLLVGNRRTVDVVLEVGEVTTDVEVSASTASVQKEDVVLGQVLIDKQIVALPLNARNFLQLAQLSAGVMETHSAISPVRDWTSRSNMSIVVAGLRETDSSYLLDGIETRSPRWGGSGFRPSIDAIQEFNVQRNAFTADQGWGTTIVNTILKSGTNDFHMVGYEFIRNDKVDARNFFDTTKPPYKQNQFGGTIGGPIVKDKIFYFAAYEGYRERTGMTYQGTVPTPAQLGGQLTKPVKDPVTGEFFPNNKIPTERIDPVIKNVIPYYPAPNTTDPVLNYRRQVSLLNDRDEIHGKVDFVLSESDRMTVKYSWVDEPLYQPALFENLGFNRPLGDQNVAITYNHFFTPKFVNEFRLGYNRNLNYSVPELAYGNDLAREIGLKNTTTNPANFTLPAFSPTGYSGIGQGNSQTQETIENLFQINENVSYIHNNHSIKFGADIRPRKFAITNDFPSCASFSFDGYYTGDAIGDFLLGIYTYTQQSIGNSRGNFSSTDTSLYVTDDWKITSQLSLNFGLRYEYFQPMSELNNKLNYLDLNTLQYVNVKGALFYPDRNNFAPRLGFAYSPVNKMVIRGGFGVFYDLIAMNETQFWGVSNPPNTQIASINNPRPAALYKVSEMFPDPAFIPSTSPNTTDPWNRTPYVYQYNLNIQKELSGVLFETGYVGSTGMKLNRRFMVNMPAGPDPVIPLQARRPFPGFNDILTSLNNGWSNYSGFNFRAERTLRNGYSLLASYTLGKFLDIGGPDEYAHRDLTNTIKEAKGPASMDSRHRLIGTFIYELPFGKDRKFASSAPSAVNAIIGGWQLSGIATFMSGQARTAVAGTDRGQIGNRRIQPLNQTKDANSDDLTGSIREKSILYPYFDVTAFNLQPYGTLGTGGRGTVRAPGINKWDFSLQKNFLVTEEVNLQFRAEFFNAFNHANFSGLGLTWTSATFGRLTSAAKGRSIQFGFKLSY